MIPTFEVVGSSPDLNLAGVCTLCDGDGQLDTGPLSKPVSIDCTACGGTGGTNPENVAKSRALWGQYKQALLD